MTPCRACHQILITSRVWRQLVQRQYECHDIARGHSCGLAIRLARGSALKLYNIPLRHFKTRFVKQRGKMVQTRTSHQESLWSRGFKLARREARALLLSPEPADSGIDSDNPDEQREQRIRQNDDSFDEESDATVEIDIPIPWNGCAQHPNRSVVVQRPARASPPLCIVELSASDDDDASVLELIIPFQQQRYKKLPTLPHKPKVMVSKCIYRFLCCFSK